MPKTKTDIATAALRYLGVLAGDEPAQAEDYAYATETLESVSAEMSGTQGLTMPADLDATPDVLLLPLSRLLASEVAPYYGLPQGNRAGAVARLRAALLQDDREDDRDLDGDGAISDYEMEAGQEALFY